MTINHCRSIKTGETTGTILFFVFYKTAKNLYIAAH